MPMEAEEEGVDTEEEEVVAMAVSTDGQEHSTDTDGQGA